MGIRPGFAALLVTCAVLCGCGNGQEDISSRPEYSGVLGHVFETRTPMIIYHQNTTAIRLESPGTAGAPGLSELPPDLPYKTFHGDIVLGVLPAGSRFQVARVYKSFSTVSGSYVDYGLRMMTPKEYRDWDLSTIGLLEYRVYPLRFDNKLVQEVKWDGGK